ncbi:MULTISPECIES: phosphatase PAP2 family protein [Flavobacterium]|uniref:Phosphatase PAP2 family protein n=1 Tax=Flavobacterium gawalongense TaxID=2594432 RepID=A0A553BNZ4_9FLAO|nr:phosphatase PAP2 family protein [Flavobacterium gawalongense]TRW99963.1 phosphatase PAP2 family protein [Flavobacterium gawalongense]TRX04412.1 phosphatase PAP2 family protein [Flavobacterium gawalongense]TRX08242.1 phosphatase PAP2 family protein [Flavobacterium gawalongense]TRX09965.1 phosphatase PAP2 family protein [Flavobacterium gawalongense]TRX24343.1 phosphatase PAP2 family protein [Flavobacterium gawalongense]
MLEKILSLDSELFIYLNSLGSETYDGLWLFITRQSNWIPLFLLLAYLLYKKLGAKQTLYLLLFIAVLLTITDQTTNLFKNGFQRLRPCNNPEINSFIRVVQFRNSYSFFSGHAANSMAVSTFLYFNFKNKIKYFGFLFLWPLIFAYSRIYLGLHYPIDILAGFLFGFIFGFLMFKIYKAAQLKYFPRKDS